MKTEKDYQAALARLDEIFDAKPGTADGDEAELLTALIEMYEEQKYPIDLPDPVSAIKFRMEQDSSLPQSDRVYLAGWDDACGEWTCALCGCMIVTNLNDDMPYWLAREHSKNCQNLD